MTLPSGTDPNLAQRHSRQVPEIFLGINRKTFKDLWSWHIIHDMVQDHFLCETPLCQHSLWPLLKRKTSLFSSFKTNNCPLLAQSSGCIDVKGPLKKADGGRGLVLVEHLHLGRWAKCWEEMSGFSLQKSLNPFTQRTNQACLFQDSFRTCHFQVVSCSLQE